MNRRAWIRSIVLFAAILGTGIALAAWKHASQREAAATAANFPEPIESIATALSQPREHRVTTTAIGTVIALQSITLRNEIAGTVHKVDLAPGKIFEKGALLVALDVAVEEAELKALQAQASLAKTTLERTQKAIQNKAASEMELERAQAEHDIALAQIARVRAIIERKTIRAPFRARVGLSDLHLGQYLQEGTKLATLQGIEDAVYLDFSLPQRVAATLAQGDRIETFPGSNATALPATIVALDAQVDASTRNATVRAKLSGFDPLPAPGASVKVRVPVGPPISAVTVPVTALRKGPAGEFVFVIVTDAQGKERAQIRKVESGAMLGDEVLIHSGLAAGEKVAASGSFKLREGVLVADATAKK